MNGYVKLFSSIVTSTIWQESLATRIVWITMLALSNKDGVVEASVPGLAHVAGVTIAEAEGAIAKLMSPDPYSRSAEYEGKRIIAIDGGWLILNRAKYRDKWTEEDRKEYKRRWMQERRKAQAAAVQELPVVDATVHACPHVDGVEPDRDRDRDIVNNISSKPSASDDDPDDLIPHLQVVWDDYLEKTGRNQKTYSYTTLRKRKALARLRECSRKTGGDIGKAVELMKLATANLVASDFHMGRDAKSNGKRYCEWDKHLFGSYEQMERWWNA